ncbi:MAG: hypothetical protein Kow0037_19130 [Calditrichia bacterium]
MKIRKICTTLDEDIRYEFSRAGIEITDEILAQINTGLLFKAFEFTTEERDAFLNYLQARQIRHWIGRGAFGVSVFLTFGYPEEIIRLADSPFGQHVFLAYKNSLKDQFHLKFPRGEYVIDSPKLMGILNVTPDSFSDGGRYNSLDSALKHAGEMLEAGADLIDIGAESTRPGAKALTEEEEWSRLKDIIPAIRKMTEVPISLDTYKSEIARRGLEEGVDIVNDISGMTFDRNMKKVVSDYQVPIILMHIKGTPQNMQRSPHYDLLMEEVWLFLNSQIEEARQAGIQDIIVDAGIGFGKRIEDNFELIRRQKEFSTWGCPILLGPSRKTFLKGTKDLPPAERVWGTAAAISAGIFTGAKILRVHDLEEMGQVREILTQVLSSRAK